MPPEHVSYFRSTNKSGCNKLGARTVVTETHHVVVMEYFLRSRKGGPPGSIWGQTGVKQVQLGGLSLRAELEIFSFAR